ncbi:MAG: protein-export chaperone SecB [Crocinitomicaceae bacterium]|nr:protein-export chaperone SecB [Crocinitomicaceae bacterium]MBK8926671.1 protein-export chaperone SecB [Crocinitomicaceae bacterium]
MIEAKPASFSMESFRVPKFSYDEGNHMTTELKLAFMPSGVFDSTKSEFQISLNLVTHDSQNENKIICEVNSVALFKFDRQIKLEEIPPYFYQNAIAIMFPYIRAFISTLTLQANTKLLKLGLMNLSDLENPLRANTKVI